MASATTPGGLRPHLVGGHEAQAPPGIVSVQFDAPSYGKRYVNFHTCGGALVFRGWVLTNAHCVTDMPNDASAVSRRSAAGVTASWMAARIPVTDRHYHVRVGSTDRTRGGETATVTRIVVHPGWQWGEGAPRAEVDDIVMLKLDHLVQQPTIPLASRPAQPGARVVLYGWGDTEPDSGSRDLPRTLHQLDTAVTSPTGCGDPTLSAKEICTDNPNGTDGACNGDSGGPAVQTINGVAELVGGASRRAAHYCGASGTIYTSQPEFRHWIYDVARGASAS